MPALVVDEQFAEPPVVLYQHFRIGRGNRYEEGAMTPTTSSDYQRRMNTITVVRYGPEHAGDGPSAVTELPVDRLAQAAAEGRMGAVDSRAERIPLTRALRSQTSKGSGEAAAVANQATPRLGPAGIDYCCLTRFWLIYMNVGVWMVAVRRHIKDRARRRHRPARGTLRNPYRVARRPLRGLVELARG